MISHLIMWYSTNPSTSLGTLLALLASQRSASKDKIQQKWLVHMLSSLLSKQLLRKGGILGLLNVLLGRSESGECRTIFKKVVEGCSCVYVCVRRTTDYTA